jgi:predicted nucleotidyltransferase component of viral defense system
MIKYRLRPIFVSHYDPEAAYHQKILALIHRTETQARDVFDLHHLLQTQKILNVVVTEEEKKIAMTQAMSINFPHFKSQVVAYLEPEYRAQYDDPMIWDQLVMKVCAHLGGL